MTKLIKIYQSPFHSPLEIVNEIVIQLHVPYSKSSITVIINTNIQDYKERDDNGGVLVRQVMVSSHTNDTSILSFDFDRNRSKNYSYNGIIYNIELLNIGEENIQGQKFMFFEFRVTY